MDSPYKKAYDLILLAVNSLKEKPSFTHGNRANLEATRNKGPYHVHLDQMTAVNAQGPDATSLMIRYNVSLVLMVPDTVRDEHLDPVGKFDYLTDISLRLQAALIQSSALNITGDIVTTPARYITDDQSAGIVLQFQLEVDAIPSCEGYEIVEYTVNEQEQEQGIDDGEL